MSPGPLSEGLGSSPTHASSVCQLSGTPHPRFRESWLGCHSAGPAPTDKSDGESVSVASSPASMDEIRRRRRLPLLQWEDDRTCAGLANTHAIQDASLTSSHLGHTPVYFQLPQSYPSTGWKDLIFTPRSPQRALCTCHRHSFTTRIGGKATVTPQGHSRPTEEDRTFLRPTIN